TSSAARAEDLPAPCAGAHARFIQTVDRGTGNAGCEPLLPEPPDVKHFAEGPEVALKQTALEVRNHRCHLLQCVECLTDVGPLLAKHTRRVPGDPSEKDQQMLFEVQPLLVVEKDRFDVNGSVRIEAEHVEPSECSSVLV